ncbi:hypothetical protein BH09SUM1_BH09SUM1_01590 [soil metagenome]
MLAGGLILSRAAAEQVIVPAKAGEQYAEIGAWGSGPIASTAPGLPEGGMSRALAATADEKLVGSVEFRYTFPTAGQYYVSVTWPAVANARNVSFLIRGAGTEITKKLDFTPAGIAGNRANQWVLIDRITTAANVQWTVMVNPETSNGTVDPAKPYMVAVDAIKFDTEGAPGADEILDINSTPVATMAFGAATPAPDVIVTSGTTILSMPPAAKGDMPFSVPGSSDVTPVPPPTAASSDSPFAAPGMATPAATMSTAASGMADDPFAKSGMMTPVPTNAMTEGSPFGIPSGTSAPNTSDDPFAKPVAPMMSATPKPQDPFASMGGMATPTPASSGPLTGLSTAEMAPTMTPAGMTATPTPASEVSMDFSTPTPEAPAVKLPFHNTIQAAVADAKKNDRMVLVLFSGDSIQAHNVERVMGSAEVAKVLGDFELVRLDYRESRDVARKYAVKSFPYLVMLDKYGYTEGHVLPSGDGDALIKKLQPYAQRLFTGK